jgi:plastocyanin
MEGLAMKRFLRAAMTMGALAPFIFVTPTHTYAAGTVHRVEIAQFAFSPHDIIVSSGDIIEFTNADYVPHTATANDESFDTKQLDKDGVGRIVAGKPGTYDFGCKFHTGMKGKLVVE